MAWDGYFRLGDNEFINRPRTLAYARALGLYWVKDPNDNEYLSAYLGHSPYVTPEDDGAPWVDPDNPHSYGFCGVLPIEVSGLEDSTRQSEVFEYTTDGGNPGRLRHKTKPVVFNVALIGASDAACEYGFRWLKRALLKNDCTPQGGGGACRGQELTYAAVEPVAEIEVVDDEGEFGDVLDGGDPESSDTGEIDGGGPAFESLTAEWLDFERHLREVLVNHGPTVTAKKSLKSCRGSVWSVTFTATAGDPFEYGTYKPILRDWGDGTDPYDPTVTGTYGTTTYVEESCPAPVYTPIYDPLCPALVAPPPPPDIFAGCFDIDTGTTWSRLHAEIPEALIPLWDEVRPVVTIRTADNDARMVRVRFYEEGHALDEGCEAVGEFVISYVPALHTLVIDTVAQAVYAYSGDGVIRRADSLVYGDGNAKPIQWFGLSCGDSYVVTLDRLLSESDPVEVDLDLAPRSA